MINTGASFIFSVLTFYSFFHYMIQQNDYFRDLSWKHVQWEVVILTTTITVISSASSMAYEVHIERRVNKDQITFTWNIIFMVWIVGKENFWDRAWHYKLLQRRRCHKFGMFWSKAIPVTIHWNRNIQLDSFSPTMFDLVVFPCPKQSQLHKQSKGQMNLNDFFSRSNERYLESNIRLENNLWSWMSALSRLLK